MKRKTASRPPFYLLTGLVIGIIAGILFDLIFLPLQYVNTAPHALRDEDKDTFRRLVALSYQQNQDIGRAEARLGLLQETNPAATLAAQSNRMISSGELPQEAQVVDRLAKALVQPRTATPMPQGTADQSQVNVPQVTTLPSLETFDPEQAIYSPTPLTPSPRPTETPGATFTPRWSTSTPLPASGIAFLLDKRTQVCNSKSPYPLLQVQVVSRTDKPLPGARITVTWKDGEDVFYTGLHSGQNEGYADFRMQADTTYQLRVGVGGELIKDLAPVQCISDDGKAFLGGWMLVFTEP